MKTGNAENLKTGEAESLAQQLFTFGLAVIAVASFAIAFLIATYPSARDPDIVSWRAAILMEMMLAVGTSIVSSGLIYFFYSRVVEKRVLAVVTENAAQVAAKYATSLYENRFERMMPTEVFSAIGVPNPAFESYLQGVLDRSKTYWFKGDDGGFTVYRINSLPDHAHFLRKQIVLLLLDPTDDYLLRERAKMDLAQGNTRFSKDNLNEAIEQLRKGIFASVVAIFDNCHRTRVQLGFHKEHLFFRSEIFDEGIFLTYYLGGEFPDTCFYPDKTLTYQACWRIFVRFKRARRIQLSPLAPLQPMRICKKNWMSSDVHTRCRSSGASMRIYSQSTRN
jgi:hypothetical protein